jgi:hypothetical protein
VDKERRPRKRRTPASPPAPEVPTAEAPIGDARAQETIRGNPNDENALPKVVVRDRWDKGEIIAKILGSVMIPVVIAGATIYFTFASQKEATREKRLEVAVSVLQSSTGDQRLREWALREASSDLNFSLSVQDTLKVEPLPTGSLHPPDQRCPSGGRVSWEVSPAEGKVMGESCIVSEGQQRMCLYRVENDSSNVLYLSWDLAGLEAWVPQGQSVYTFSVISLDNNAHEKPSRIKFSSGQWFDVPAIDCGRSLAP